MPKFRHSSSAEAAATADVSIANAFVSPLHPRMGGCVASLLSLSEPDALILG